MVQPNLRCVKGGANMSRALLTFEKYETTNYGLSGIYRYSQNIFQWNKNNMESTRMTTGDYWEKGLTPFLQPKGQKETSDKRLECAFDLKN